MSYILDALKKSEAERSSKDRPEFAHRVPFEPAPRRQREIWPYLLVLVLLANAIGIGYVVWPGSGSGDAAAVSGEPAPAERQGPVKRDSAAGAPEQPVQDQAEPGDSPVVSQAPQTPRKTDTPETAEAPARDPVERSAPQEPVREAEQAASERQDEAREDIPSIRDMPRSVQRRVPEMTFNAHLHSSNPSSRRVMINNQMLREGDRVGGMVIREITTAGVVFRLDQHVFQIDVVRDWQGAL